MSEDLVNMNRALDSIQRSGDHQVNPNEGVEDEDMVLVDQSGLEDDDSRYQSTLRDMFPDLADALEDEVIATTMDMVDSYSEAATSALASGSMLQDCWIPMKRAVAVQLICGEFMRQCLRTKR